jgi:hypothetical protein
MVRHIREFYLAPVKITRHRGQFADIGHQQLLKSSRGMLRRQSFVCHGRIAE